MDENFILDFTGGLDQSKSQEQIKKDVKNLGDIKVPLVGTLSPKTAEQLKKDIAAQKGTVNLSGKIDSKGVASSLQQVTTQAQKQANARPVEVGVDFAVKKDKLVNDIRLLAQQNSKLFKDTDMSIKYNSLLDDASMARNSVELSSLRSQLAAFKTELKVTGNMGLTLGDSLKKSLSKVMGLLGNFNVVMQLNQQLKNAWTEAKTLDDSLVDLQKVTDSIVDRDALYKYFDKAMDKAQDLNVQVNSLIYAITEFKKLGWSLSDAELGGEWATILQNVGDVDIDTAIGSIKTAIASFDEIGGYTDAQMDKKLEAYTDLINNMSNRYSVDAQSLSEAIRLSAGTLTEAHTSIEQAATMFSTANKYYNDASYLGNTVKIGSLRVRASEGDDDAISELKEMGEEIDDLTVATSSLREKLLSLTGVDIMVDDQTFKSYYDQLYEISQVIDDLSDTSRANVLETLFGKNRSAAGAALLSGMKESADAYKDAINSAGSATKEYETWMQSADAASQRFANNLTKTYQSIINGNTVRDFTNLGSAVLEFANSWGLVEGALKGGLTIGAMKCITNLTVALKNSAVQVSNYGAALEAVNQLGNFAEGTDEYIDKIDKLKTSCSVLTDTQLKQVLAHKNLSDAQLIEILQLDKLEDAQQQARLTQLGLTRATEAQTEASMANLSITNMLRVAWTKFTAVVKANPMAVGITAIVAATYAAMKASEAWTNRLKDQAQESSNAYKNTLQEIESINSELQANGQRIDELNAKENLTLVEAEELERLKESNRELENTLALKEKIAQQEKAGANKDAVKYFEEDTNKYNKETGTYDSTHIEVATQYLDEIYAKEQRIHEIELEMSRTDTKTEKYRELSGELDITQKSYDDLLQRVQDYNDVFTDLDDYLFEGQDDELIQQLEEFYKYMNEVLYGIAETNTNAIRDILAKADFQSASKQLEELGKSGELSVETLSAKFPKLIQYIEDAGISVQELYQYIMALSDPDALNYAEIEKQFRQSVGIRDGEINGASDQKMWDEIKSSFDDDEWQIALEAYVKVRDQYGEHPEGWTVKDWVTNIQNELETELLEVEMQLSISQTVDQLNTQIKPAFDSLKSAWQEIFTDDGFALNSIDILSTCDSIKSKLDEMSEIGLDVDYSAFENLVTVLNDTESTEYDVETAFDALATSITQAGLSGTEDFETMKAALEDLGVVNNEMVAFDNLISKTNALADAGIDLANATEAEMQAFVDESVSAEHAGEALALLQLKKALINQTTITTSADCQNIINLANAANVGIAYLEQLNTLMNLITQRDSAHASGDSRAVSELNRAIRDFSANVVNNLNLDDVKVDFTPIGSGAKSAGSKAGKDYKDALKEQLSDLDSVISGITGRIDDQISSINEQKSAALDAIDAEKEALEEAKDAAVEALEAERDARLEVIETQKKQLEEQIKLIDKQIKAKQDEIDKINDAADARAREITLQEKQYALEQKRNQRTKLVYTESSGMIYRPDEQGIRKAKEAVDDAKRQIEIGNIQKEIDLLEDQKDLLNEQIDLLDERADAINKYYDEQIKQTEKFYDAQIKALEKQRKSTESYFESIITNLENSKSKYQELTEILEKAELSAKLKQLGIDEEALLNGSEEEFQKLKDAYMNIVFQLNEGNDEVLSSLRELSGYDGTAPAMLDKSNTELTTMNDNLAASNTNVGTVNSSLSDTATKTSDVATNVSTLNDNLSQVNNTVTQEQTAFDTLRQRIDEVITAINEKITATQAGQATTALATTTEMACYMLLRDKILEVKDSLETISNTTTMLDATPVNNLTTAFQLLYNQLLLVSATLGAGMEGAEEGAVGGITSAINALNEISLEEGIIAQFTNLKTAIDEVTSAIGGGGGGDSEGSAGGEGSGSSGGKSGGGKSGGKGSKGEGGGGGDSLTGAIETMGETAKEVIGEPDAEGDGTVIGEFGALETAVTDVTSAIGGGESEGGEGQGKGSGSKGENGEGTLIGSIENLGETTEEVLGEPGGEGVIGRFEKFKEPIQEAETHVKGISTGLDEIDGKEVECTIKVNIEVSGSTGFTGSAKVLGSMNLNSAEYNAKYTGASHAEGTAMVSGNWAVQSDEQNALVGEVGRELIVRGGRFFTVGDNGAEMFDIKKGDIVFNHEQTEDLLKHGHISGRGKAYADGTVGGGKILTKDGSILRPLQPGDKMYDLVQKFDAYFKSMDGNLEKLVPSSFYEHNREMNKLADQISYVNSVVNNNRNMQQPVTVNQNVTLNCPNLTNNSGVEYVQKQLGNLSLRAIQEPLHDY